MKIIKKIASLLGAVALMSALLPVAYAADNTPTISAEITDFTNTAGETFNVVITLSGMSGLFLNETTWDEWGMNALQVEVKMPGTYKTDYTGTGARAAFVATSTDFATPDTLLAGVTDGILKISAVWNNPGSYNYSSSGKITVPVKLLNKYPEYTNESLTYSNCKVETSKYDATTDKTTDVMYYQTDSKIAFDKVAKLQYKTYVADNATSTAVGNKDQFESGKQLYYVSKILDNALASKKVQLTRIKSDKSEETMTSSSSLADLLGGVAVDGTAISGDVAVGVHTSVTDATYEVKLVD